jgi:hypothetical protein
MEQCEETGIREALANRVGTRFVQLSAIFDQFKYSGHPHLLLASAADICCLREIRVIMETSSDEEFHAFKASFSDRIPELSHECIEAREDFMANLVPGPVNQPTETTSADTTSTEIEPVSVSPRESLKLATTWFQCAGCREIFRYDCAHRHPCLSKNQWRGVETDAYIKQLNAHPWNLCGDGIKYIRPEADLFTACAVDPEIVTAADMDKLKARFVIAHPNSVGFTSWRGIVRV